MKIEAVIFDWAGTTVDYGCFAPLEVFMKIFHKRGVEVTAEEARKPMGLLKIDHVRALTEMPRIANEWKRVFGQLPTEADIHEMYKEFEEILFAILPNYATPIDGIREVMASLRKRGIKIGSTTGYTREMMDIVAKEAKLQGYKPDFLVTPDDVPAGRPYPWMCYKNAMELGVYPMNHMIKVGDTVSDMNEGRNAGMWTVGVILGSSELGLSEWEVETMDPVELHEKMEIVRNRFVENGAHFTIETMQELENVIEHIEKQELIIS
ncbi:phosphonoacetaldehyde hydrolase [Bacillus toyonensis]|uniref:phosphonoacetaldehyde hydrolase n=1 Tax=Bacillus toyonensis TaxID=155322 RepID=UPI000BEF4F02|nr:phosphonoacetaldehyde hydrolase [Bacillus toyonensis]MDF9447037.1 phosphonoacetaldehyde hydrolase [Bacillus toyonensis]MDG1560907.1 phosphonoacetaldehyde hydrolase [Bacillus toyonensis]MED3538086.1 phosphonoacetaldehyde hydrolase [Bacillus toyonensis]MEE2016821.1 phosphonoacetaldehyde hydrolase [Bacillus toyonensis]PEK08568.1 phosphonoacetaldehyde hydrolase [Bacillus toyonensis]